MRRVVRVLQATLLLGLVLGIGIVIAADPDGKSLYDGKCAMCHGKDGVAKEMYAKQGARNFNDPAWQKENTDDAIAKNTTDGIAAKKMPAYKDKLSAADVSAIVKYIRTLAPAK
jgi:mono/diheme cytochrome c family protein